MGIPAYPLLTGDDEKDASLLDGYRRLCLENLTAEDVALLGPDFPQDHIPEALNPAKPGCGCG